MGREIRVGRSRRVTEPEPEALTAGAVVAETEKGREVGAVAEEHNLSAAPDYGDTYWHEASGRVFWVCADYTTNDEADAAVAAFLAVEGVGVVEACAECAAPDGGGWEMVYARVAGSEEAALAQPETFSTELAESFETQEEREAYERVLAIARTPLTYEDA